ncbi:substrate-binding domain-containing protein [Actinomyces vulturis]|uniref:substrate-binding domain-containing protein n=1 Tax=Actinomyces vulturis TaxID=1857645 RepID=UPI000835B35D|nr:substrate-binding domain-containing protein [Actinomyces vulturis]
MSRELPAKRREDVLALVNAHGSIRVTQIAQALDVSAITVRRDIAYLSEQGLLEQVRGGARAITTTPIPTRTPVKIGVVTPSLDFFWPTILDGAGHAADRHGARLLLQGSTFAARDNLTEVRRMTEQQGVDGLIAVPDIEGEGSEELHEFLATLSIPVVLIERAISPTARHRRYFESVRTDHYFGATLAVEHLVDLGHKRIALITDKPIPSRHAITDGWRDAMKDFGLDTSSPHIDTTMLRGSQASDRIGQCVRDCLDDDTTAIIAHSDEAALLAVEYVVSMGYKVPDDLSIVTYDDELATLTRPTLTAVAPPKQFLGSAAVDALIDRIHHPNAPMRRQLLAPSLIVRDSSGTPRKV